MYSILSLVDENGEIVTYSPTLAHQVAEIAAAPTTYTNSPKGDKWHIKQNTLWTLCYRLCAGWKETANEIADDGDTCEECRMINEARLTGVGVPF